jgi:hypothetical protein
MLRVACCGAPAPRASFILWLQYQILWNSNYSCVHSKCICPARAAAGSGRAPCTHGQGLRPLDPQFDAFVCQALDVHGYGHTTVVSFS